MFRLPKLILGVVVALGLQFLDPVYGMAAPSTVPKNFRSGVNRLSDGTGSAVTLVWLMGQGDLDCGPLGEFLNEDVPYTARTLFIGLGTGKPRFPKISGSFLVGNLVGNTNSAPGSFLEFITGKGAYSANISTLGGTAGQRRMTVDIRQTIEGTAHGDTADETIDFEDCVVTVQWTEREEGNLCKWEATCFGNVIITNSTNVVTISQAT